MNKTSGFLPHEISREPKNAVVSLLPTHTYNIIHDGIWIHLLVSLSTHSRYSDKQLQRYIKFVNATRKLDENWKFVAHFHHFTCATNNKHWKHLLEQLVLPLNVYIGNRIKAYSPAWYDCPKSDSLTRGDRLQDKMQKRQTDAMSFHLLQTTCLHITQRL